MSTQSQYVKKWHKAALQDVVQDLVKEKKGGWKNRTARDSYTTKLKSLELIGISITRDALYKRVERESKKKPNEPTSPFDEVITNDTSELSSMSSTSMGSNITDCESQVLQTSTISSSKAGRPKGSTMQKKREDISKYKQCLNAITEEYHKELTSHKETQQRPVRGHLKEIIQQKKEEFGVSDDISAKTIRGRIMRGSLAPTHPGTSPPVLKAETALVQICIQMGKMRQPLTCGEAIAIMNDMISKTEMEEQLKNFQSVRTFTSHQLGTVGKNWWRGFKKRHAGLIVSKKGEKFALNRADWTKLSNIKQMYEYIYDEMVNANIASPQDNPIYLDREGNEVEESERFGLIQEFRIDHADYIDLTAL